MTPYATTGTATGPLLPVQWSDAEPERLSRDLADVATFAPDLRYQEPIADSFYPHGGWVGELPRWPFDRPEPDGLVELLAGAGLRAAVVYRAAYPMVPPIVYPLDPEPTLQEQTQSVWHVAGGGSLCLLRSVNAWLPEASITELLMKAAGWRIEYALMKASVIKQMTVNGIVSDSSLDPVIADTAQRLATNHPEDTSHDADGPQ